MKHPKRILAGLCLILGLAACQDSGLDLAANGKRITVGPAVPVAIESLVGAPDDVAPRLSAALAGAAQEREIIFVDADKAPRFRMKGYVSAVTVEGGAAVTLVFDLFDQDLKRAQRVQTTETIKRMAEDPWRAIDDPGLRRVVARGMNEVAEFLAGVARPETPVAGQRPQTGQTRAAAE